MKISIYFCLGAAAAMALLQGCATAPKDQYHQQISDAVSPVRGAQFLQVENLMAIFVDLTIASDMPVVGSLPPAK